MAHKSCREFLVNLHQVVVGLLGTHRSYSIANKSVLNLEGRLSLGQRKDLVLVRCMDKRFLLTADADKVSLITEIKSEEQDLMPKPKVKEI